MKKKLKHILIAEDDDFLVSMMKNALLEHDVRVSTARNGREAIAIIEKNPPHVLLLDILMPIVDGYKVLQHRKERGLSFAVVVCSNLGDKESREKCKSLGVSEYVVKSDMDDEALWPAIEKYLQ